MANDILIRPTASKIEFSGSAHSSIRLEVQDSGSVVFQGSSGSLFGITDSMSGSLFSVNDVSGLPILEVFSDDKVTLGRYQSPIIIDQSGSISGSLTSTASFGKYEGITSFAGSAGTETTFSGSITSTGSFGNAQIATEVDADRLGINGLANHTGVGIAVHDKTIVLKQSSGNDSGTALVFSEAALSDNSFVIAHDGSGSGRNNKLKFKTYGNVTAMELYRDKALVIVGNVTGSGDISGSLTGTGSFGALHIGLDGVNKKSSFQVGLAAGEFAHFGDVASTSHTNPVGITFGYREVNNTNYRKVGIAGKQIGDFAARGELHLLVDSVADGGSVGIEDSKLMIEPSGSVTIPSGSLLVTAPNAKISGSITSTGSFGFMPNISTNKISYTTAYVAIASNGTGLFSTYVGAGAGGNNAANYSVFVGRNAGANNTEANTVVGANAMQYGSNGHSNVIMGYAAAEPLNDASADNNTMIGTKAGEKYAPNGASSTYAVNTVVIGGSSRLHDSLGQYNSIVIGSGAHGAGSNTAVIGNTLVRRLYANRSGSGAVYAGQLYISQSGNSASVFTGDITGSITSTASFGHIIVNGTAVTGGGGGGDSFSDGTATLISGSITSTGSLHKLKLGTGHANRDVNLNIKGTGASSAGHGLTLNDTTATMILEGGSGTGMSVIHGAAGTFWRVMSTGHLEFGHDDNYPVSFFVAGASKALLSSTGLHVKGDIRADGDIIANQYIVSSSITHLTQSFSSGSTVFGDTTDDTHEFTGSVKVTGSLELDGPVTGDISSSLLSTGSFGRIQAGPGGSKISGSSISLAGAQVDVLTLNSVNSGAGGGGVLRFITTANDNTLGRISVVDESGYAAGFSFQTNKTGGNSDTTTEIMRLSKAGHLFLQGGVSVSGSSGGFSGSLASTGSFGALVLGGQATLFANSDDLRFNKNFGIGINPDSNLNGTFLHIKDAANAHLKLEVNGPYASGLWYNNSSAMLVFYNDYQNATNYGGFAWRVSGGDGNDGGTTEIMRLRGSRLGIMNDSPPKTLTVGGDISGSGDLDVVGDINLTGTGSISGSIVSTGSFGEGYFSQGIRLGIDGNNQALSNFTSFASENSSHNTMIIKSATGDVTLATYHGSEQWYLQNDSSPKGFFFKYNGDGVSGYPTWMMATGSTLNVGIGITDLDDTNKLQVGGNALVTGSLTVNGNVTGSITSTGSFGKLVGDGSSLTGVSAFPYNSTTRADVTGSMHISSSVGTATASLVVEGSGSEVFTVKGTNGTLFSVSDELSGSLFAVTNVAGLPVVEAFSNNKVNIGPFSKPVSVTDSGSLTVSGSMTGVVVSMSIASNTASMDARLSNFFHLQLASGADTYLTASNISPGQSLNLQVTQQATSGTLSFSDQFKFPNGMPYAVSATGSGDYVVTDLVSFVSFDSQSLFGTALKNLV